MKRFHWILLIIIFFKEPIRLLIFVTILLSIGAFFVWVNDNKTSTLNIKETEFSIPDTANVNKIFLASKLGWQTTLEKINGQWYINKMYKASHGMVKMLMGTMHMQRIKRPVFAGERNTVIKNIAARGTKVEVYINGEIFKTFYVGGNTNKSEGTYFIMKGSENPFVVYLPGLRGFLDSRYIVKEDDYRDTQLFASSFKSLKRISVRYPKNLEKSFFIQKQEGELKLFGPEKFDQTQVDNYILNLKNTHIVNYLDLENDKVRVIYDSLINLVPDAEIEVEDSKPGFSNSIKIYLNPGDPDGGYGIAQMAGDEKFVYYQDFVFRNLLVPSDFFLPKN
jgi:hypothetical protein